MSFLKLPYICFTLSWIDGRVKSTLWGLSRRPPSLSASLFLLLHHLNYSSNEDLPFQWHPLLHHFSVLKSIWPHPLWMKYFIFKAYLNSTTGLHVAFKANQSPHALIQHTFIELLLYARKCSTHGHLVVKEALGFFVQLTIKCWEIDDNAQMSKWVTISDRFSSLCLFLTSDKCAHRTLPVALLDSP